MLTPTFTLPPEITEVSIEAFAGIGAKVVFIPDDVTVIRSKAFANCTYLRQIRIPESVTSIADDAFSGCPSTLVIYGKKGSAAETFAAAKGFTFRQE